MTRFSRRARSFAVGAAIATSVNSTLHATRDTFVHNRAGLDGGALFDYTARCNARGLFDETVLTRV